MISKAFEIAEHVIIGIVRDEALAKLDKICREAIQPYDIRILNVISYINNVVLKKFPDRTYEVIGILGPYDVVLEEKRKIDYIVVSDETLPRAVMINILRENKGLNSLEIVIVPMVKDEYGRPISAHRFRTGELEA